MSDSGFTGPPPVTPPAASELRPQRGDVLKVVDTAGMIRDNARTQRLAGEIVAESKDGTLRIATPAGEIAVQKPAARPDLIVGAKLEIEVPPGHPPRQITVRDAQPPQAQQPQTPSPAPEAPPRETPPPVITAPPRPPVNIPEQPPAPPPQTPPAPVTPEQIIRLLPLPPQQAAQIILPPAEIIDIRLPALPAPGPVAAQQVALAAPDLLTAALVRLPLATPVPHTMAQQLANVIVPQMPASAFVTPASVPGGLPPAVQASATQLIENIVGLGKPPSFLPASAVPDAPLIKFMPPVAVPAATASFSLLTARIPPAMAAFAALAPENLIQTAPAAPAAIAAPSGMIAPKMDAQIIAITPPAVTLSAPGAPAMVPPPLNNSNPFMPQTAAAFAAPPAVPAGMLAGQVSGMTAQNFPVLSVALPSFNAVQDFVMQFPADNMQPGAAVTMQPPPGALASMAAAVMPPVTPLPELMVPGLWPALDEAFQALQSAAPQTAHIMAQTAIPSAAAPRMPAVIMMFVAAMQGGDLQTWLGDRTIDTLRRIGKADIISRINRDGAAINRLAAAADAAPAQDWRSLPVPMMWDNHIHKIMLHYRHDREASQDGEGKKKGTRFVLDIAPPRMGNVQLDGLHRPGEPAIDPGGRLDLIVRTTENLSPPMQQAMRRLYVRALESASLSGELSFQNKSASWVEIAKS